MMNVVAVEDFSQPSFMVGDIDDIKKESNEIRSGTMSRIDEMKREIALLIAEYDEDSNSDDYETNDLDQDSMTFEDNERLSDSVRIIKLKN